MKIVNIIKRHLKKSLEKHTIYKWYVIRPQKYKYLKNKLLNGYYYDVNKLNNNTNKTVVCVFDGRIKQGGLADRLRGIISTYYLCKQKKLCFKISFVNPFNLTNYLIPNCVDWQISPEDLNYNLCDTNVCFLDTNTDTKFEKKKQKKWLNQQLNLKYKEIHVITNAAFSYDVNYSTLFKELFKLSPRLENTILKHKKILGTDYLSISCRFLDLLGDFNETYGTNKQLQANEKENLILANLIQLHKLHCKYPKQKILVNSDSITFLNRAKEKEYVYVIEGNVTHIDNTSSTTYETYEKTFVDFFMIANASKIFLFKTNLMHNSGYPYAASLIYNKPFERIIF